MEVLTSTPAPGGIVPSGQGQMPTRAPTHQTRNHAPNTPTYRRGGTAHFVLSTKRETGTMHPEHQPKKNDTMSPENQPTDGAASWEVKDMVKCGPLILSFIKPDTMHPPHKPRDGAAPRTSYSVPSARQGPCTQNTYRKTRHHEPRTPTERPGGSVRSERQGQVRPSHPLANQT